MTQLYDDHQYHDYGFKPCRRHQKTCWCKPEQYPEDKTLMCECEEKAVTEAFDVWWHLEQTEGHQWIVARVPQIGNQVTQAETFDDLKVAIKELVAAQYDTITPEEVTVGEFTEEAEADFLELFQL